MTDEDSWMIERLIEIREIDVELHRGPTRLTDLLTWALGKIRALEAENAQMKQILKG